MSQTKPPDDPEQIVRDQLAEDFQPHMKSRQAVYHDKNGREAFTDIDRHDDGARMYKDFGLTPFHKALTRSKRRDGLATTYPEAYLNHLIHVDDAELDALQRGDLSIFADAPHTRRKVMEFLADPDNSTILAKIGDGGTGFHAHARPGKGKTSFQIAVGVVRNMEVNNDTFLWQLTLDECEPLPLAPYMTLAVPAGVDLRVKAVPVRYDLPTVTIDPTDVFRAVIEYTDPIDLLETVVPGGLYGVLPDPRFRKCERLTGASYNSAWDPDIDTPNKVTHVRDWGHALLEARAIRDVYLHPTTIFFDEFGDMCPRNPEADEHDQNVKTKDFAKRYAKGRKKNLSVNLASHTLVEVDEEIEMKEKCFVTLPETEVESCKGPPTSPLPVDKPRHLEKGEAFAWNTNSYVELSWPNPYRTFGFRGEIKLEYPGLEAQKDAL